MISTCSSSSISSSTSASHSSSIAAAIAWRCARGRARSRSARSDGWRSRRPAISRAIGPGVEERRRPTTTARCGTDPAVGSAGRAQRDGRDLPAHAAGLRVDEADVVDDLVADASVEEVLLERAARRRADGSGGGRSPRPGGGRRRCRGSRSSPRSRRSVAARPRRRTRSPGAPQRGWAGGSRRRRSGRPAPRRGREAGSLVRRET